MKVYSQDFYRNRHENTIHSASTILSILLERIPAVHSAVDIGCGVGTWLSVLQEKGVEDIQGIDGSWVDRDVLAIPRTCFRQMDLRKSTIKLPQRYDLAISLEVAEHLPSDRAEEFVSSLTALSDYVLFSAAIPHQGGVNHVNEQWQHYWVELFGAMGYVVHDFIRPRIWTDNRIPYWYRQNILLFSKQQTSKNAQYRPSELDTRSMPLDLVHPDLYQKRVKTTIGVKSSLRRFRRDLGDYISRTFGKDS
jgi:cyclopropane fatty-acyl-phospholipid synthase-like methyltransferase